MKIKTENAALKALNENPFVLGKVSKHLWKKPSLLRQAFGIFEKGSPDRLGALEDLIDKLENNWFENKWFHLKLATELP